MKLILFSFLFLTACFSWSQTWFTQLDSTVSNDGVTYYKLEAGEMNGKNRLGDWSIYQFNSKDTSKRIAAERTYIKNVVRSESIYRLDSKIETHFNKKGKIKSQIQYRYGKKIWSREYLSDKKTLKKTYYPDGKVSGVGNEVLVKIITGCDAGMMLFAEEGLWQYYDTSGILLDEQSKEINKNVFKKV